MIKYKYSISVPIVIRADSKEKAMEEMRNLLTKAGFDPYELSVSSGIYKCEAEWRYMGQEYGLDFSSPK